MTIAIIILLFTLAVCLVGWFRRFVDTWTLVTFIKDKGYPNPTNEELDACRKKVMANLPRYLFR